MARSAADAGGTPGAMRDEETGSGKGKGKSKGKGRGRGKGKGKGKSKSRSPRPPLGTASKWAHPGGIPLSEVKVGELYDGVVTNRGRFGVFVDIGATKDGLLKSMSRYAFQDLKRGMDLRGLQVLSCNPQAQRLILGSSDDAHLGAAPAGGAGRSRSAPPAGSSSRGPGGRAAGRGAAGSLPPRGRAGPAAGAAAGAEEERVPLEELKPGTVLDGVVKVSSKRYGVFLDVGAASDARLRIGARLGHELYRSGDVIQDLHVDWVSPQLRRIQVSRIGEDPDPGTADATRSGPQPVQNGRDGTRKPLSAIQEGSLVDGYVSDVGARGIFVDIGCVRPAKMAVSPELAREIQQGDEVVGMRVERVDREKGSIIVTIQDPELAITQEAGPPQPQAKVRTPPTHRTRADVPAVRPQEGLPSLLSVGDFVDGTVTQAGPSGIFVDIGRGMKANLAVASSLVNQFRNGDQVFGMRVERISADELLVSIEEPRLDIERTGPPPVRGPRGGAAAAQAPRPLPPKPRRAPSGPAGRPASAPDAASGRRPLERLRTGALVTGTVTRLGPAGVFLDFGATSDGRLNVSREDAKKFQIGDEVEGMVIETVSPRRGQVTLALTYELGDEPCEAAAEPAAQPRAAAARAGPGPSAGRPGPSAGQRVR